MAIITEKKYTQLGEVVGRLFKVSSRRNGVDMIAATLAMVVQVDTSAGPPGSFGVIGTFTTSAEVRTGVSCYDGE
jgi:hypothetical protein